MILLWIVIGLLIVVVMAGVFTSLRDAALRRSGILPPAGQATMADVARLIQAGKRIEAIRVYREIHHVGLAEAKRAVDELSVTA